MSGFTKEHRIYPVVTLVINWDSRKWDGPTKLSDMFVDMDLLIRKYIDDYTIKLIDPHRIDDFTKFNTMLGDVLEFIKEQKNDKFIENKLKEKDNNWKLDIDSVNAINTFAGAKISTEFEKEGIVDMCRATEVFVEKGEALKLIQQVLRKMEKGKSVEEIADDLEEKVEEIREIYLIAEELKPKYDAEKIYGRLKKACE